MKLSCKVRGEWFAVPCDKGSQTIQWLAEEALRRYNKTKPKGCYVDKEQKLHEVRKIQGGAILDMDDIIIKVLDDNEFVSIGKIF